MQPYRRWILWMCLAMIASACGSTAANDGGTGGGAGGGTAGFQQPSGTVPANFSIDDRSGKVYPVLDGGSSDLRWKGSFLYDFTTRKATLDSNWAGGIAEKYPLLYDDGPWTVSGHEPIGSTAGDYIWGVTMFVTPPATASETYNYGAIDFSTGGWIWPGADPGSFTVTAGQTAAIDAQGFALLFGNINLKLVVDITNLAARGALPDGGSAGTWDTSVVQVKGSKWSWQDAPMYDDGTHGDDLGSDQKYTFLLSNVVGPGKLVAHAGLLASGDQPQWVVDLGGNRDAGIGPDEYKVASQASNTGVTAYLTVDGGFVQQTISNVNKDHNSMVTVP